MKPTLPIHLALCLGLLCGTSCGDKNPEEAGFQALQSGDYSKAAAKLNEALAKAEAGSEKQRQLAVGRCQALAHTSAKECVETFLALADQGTVKPIERDYETVASELMQVKAYSEAARVIDRGHKAFPINQRLPEFMTKLVNLAKQGDQPGLASTLQGLGYGGGE